MEPGGSALYMSMSEKDNFAWQTYSLNVIFCSPCQENVYPFRAMIMVFGFLQAEAYAITMFMPLSFSMCVSLITLEALDNFSHSYQEGKDVRDINFL